MDKVQVFVLHWARRVPIMHPWNGALLNLIRSIQRFTKYPYEIIVVYNCDDEHLEDLQERLPKGVRLEEDTRRKGASGARNMCVELAETDYFAVLDNDMRVPQGWLSNLVTEVQHAESYFNAPCVLRPLALTYLEEFPITADAYERVIPLQEFVKFCRSQRVPCNDDGVVQCRAPWTGHIAYQGTKVTDNGWSLSNWLASREAFDYIGYSDEDMNGWWGEDCEWAIRALQTHVKLLESSTVFIQHVYALTVRSTAAMRTTKNRAIFLKKHGKEIIDEAMSGEIWPRLHREQLERFPIP